MVRKDGKVSQKLMTQMLSIDLGTALEASLTSSDMCAAYRKVRHRCVSGETGWVQTVSTPI